jgi:tRNA pseudouridine13 synthase
VFTSFFAPHSSRVAFRLECSASHFASLEHPMPAYLTSALPGIGGLIKQHLDDFRVEEIPLYKADGVGTHCYIKLEKRNFSTMAAADILAKALGRKNIDIGYAGLKDKIAVTTQWFSVEHLDTSRARSMELPAGLKVVEITRHKNKIKRGHLAGNRFIIKIRNPEWSRAGASLDEPAKNAAAILESLAKTGAPNFFGPQRFGMRQDNHLLGLALITGNDKDFIDRFLGTPDPVVDHGGVLAARQSFKNGHLETALSQWPGHLRDERAALSALVRSHGNPGGIKRAVYAVNLELKKLLVSALQSYLFNKVLERRLPRLSTVLPGDFCYKHENGAAFLVPADPDAAAKEQPRADAHEISPTGPLFGFRMSETASIVHTMEEEVLKEFNLSPESFAGKLGAPGARRPLRFFAADESLESGEDAHGPYLQLAFTLPSGTYATVLLGEVMKQDITID